MILKLIHAKDADGNWVRDKGAEIPGEMMRDKDGNEFQLPSTFAEGEISAPTGIQIMKFPRANRHNWGSRMLERHIKAGFMSMTKKQITMKATNGTMVWDILKTPGFYCDHCGEKIESDELGASARLHVASEHGDAPPMEGNPCGYKKLNSFHCEEATSREEVNCG